MLNICIAVLKVDVFVPINLTYSQSGPRNFAILLFGTGWLTNAANFEPFGKSGSHQSFPVFFCR